MTKTERSPLILPSNRPPAETCAPRADFTLLAHALQDAPLLYPPTSGNRAASDLRQALTACRRHRSINVYVSLSEKVGLPLALLLRARRIKTPHVLVAHHLTSPKKRALQKRISWLQAFTRIVVLAEPQADYLQGAGYEERRTVLLPDSVDTQFWLPQGSWPVSDLKSTRFILSVGQERRDYHTLFATAREYPWMPFTVVAGSAWAKRHAREENTPPNVSVHHDLSYTDLRDLYGRSTLVVVPLEAGTLYVAGANALLEGMAMGKPVILTETPGLKGYFQNTETVHSVPAADPSALGKAICHLWDMPTGTADLCANARHVAETKHSLEAYVSALAHTVREAEDER